MALEMLGAFFLGALLSVMYVLASFTPPARRMTRRHFIKSPALLVTAHPDDESMFFAPTLLSLKDCGVTVDLLCLSTGDFDGLGSIRVAELTEAARQLGLREVRVINSKEFPDDPHTDWPARLIEETVRSACNEFQSQSIITFDEFGVSSHKNHCAIARSLIDARQRGSIPQLFCLRSLPLLRKYCTILDFLYCLMRPSSHTVYVPVRFLRTAYTVMLAHRSQLVWFRWLYIAFSVYMYKNVYTKI